MTKKTMSWIGGALLACTLAACGGATKADTTTPKPPEGQATPTPGQPADGQPATGNPCGPGATGNPCGK